MIDDVKLRAMDDNDVASIYDIENQDYFDVEKWGEIHIYQRLIGNDDKILVATLGDQVIGFMAYSFSDPKAVLLKKLVVENIFRRRGVAKKLLSSIENYFIEVEVAEKNLDAQLFLKALQFKCTKIIKDTQGILGTDVYVFKRESKWVTKQI